MKTKHFTKIRPATDIIESDSRVYIIMNIPAVPQENIHLEFYRNILYLEAKSESKPFFQEHIEAMEFVERIYSAQFMLAADVNKDSLLATLHNGVLTLELQYS